MDYRTITNKKSKQYDLVNNKLIKGNDGLFRDNNGYIAVALGSYYGNVGDRFLIKFNDGRKVKVIKADEKSDRDTVNGCYHKTDGSMIEIIVDMQKMNNEYSKVLKTGNFNYSKLFHGYIKEIYQIKQS